MFLISAIAPVQASGPGALDGFGYWCSCGYEQSASVPQLARQWRAGHAQWHSSRGDQVECG